MNEICWKKRKQMEFIAAATEQASQMKKLMELMELMKSICEWLRLDWSLLWVMPAERSSARQQQFNKFISSFVSLVGLHGFAASLSFSNTSQRQHNSIQPIKNIDWFHFVVDVFVN